MKSTIEKDNQAFAELDAEGVFDDRGKLQDFQKMIDRTLFCASSGIVAPRSAQWRGGRVYLEKSGGTLFMAASNNIRLGFTSRKVGDFFPDFEGIIVPPEVLQKIAGRKRGSAPLNISIVDKKARFHIGSNCVSAELLSGDFHKFYRDRRELPGIFPLAFSADRSALLKSLGAISPAIDRYSALSLTLSPEVLTLQTGDEECSAEDDVPCDYAGAQTTLIFHAKSFTEIIEHIDTDRVTVRFNSEKLTVAVLPEPERDNLFFIAQRKRG